MVILLPEDVRKFKVNNQSEEDVTIVGRRIRAGESYKPRAVDIPKWADDDRFLALLSSGTLSVTDESTGVTFSGSVSGGIEEVNLAVDKALGRDSFPEIEGGNFITVESGTGKITISGVASEIEEQIVLPVITTVSGNLQQQVNQGPAAGEKTRGAIFTLIFVHEGGTSKDRWYCHHGDTGMTSDRTPAVLPWDCKLMAMTFSNRDDNSDVDLEIYSVPENDTTQKDVEFVWQLRDCRVARKTNFSPEILFEAGDRVAVYAREAGIDPDYSVLTMYLQILEDNSEESVRRFSGNLSVGSTPESDS